MDRNGFAAVILLSFLILANFSEASLLTKSRPFVVRRDSLPDSQLPKPDKVTEEKKPNPKPVNEDENGKKLDNKNVVDESSNKGNNLNSGSVEHPNEDNLVNNEGKVNDKDNKKVTAPVKKGTEENSEQGKGPIKEENLSSKPTDENNTVKEKPGSKQADESSGDNKKPGSESVDDSSQDEKSDQQKVIDQPKQQAAPPPPDDSTVSKGSEGAGTVKSPPPEKKKKKKKGEDATEKKEEKSDPGKLTDEICDASKPSCTVEDLIGCIKSSDGPQVVVLVQNKGESETKANVAEENSGKGIDSKIPKKKSKLITLSLSNIKASNIVLHDGNKKCNLPLPSPGDEENSFMKFPTYDKLITPVNGAYFIILTALIFGGTFACIKFSRRRRQGDGIPYQELEMGFPESVSAADLETAEGWDQGWDDDWDNDSAVKSPASRHAVSISANGLTSRSPNKDGWEDNWDD